MTTIIRAFYISGDFSEALPKGDVVQRAMYVAFSALLVSAVCAAALLSAQGA